MRTKRPPCPTEAAEQRAVFHLRAIMIGRYPALGLLYASPQGELYRRAHYRPQLPGMAPGLPDLHLPVSRQGWHGLWIELKRLHGGKVSPEQEWWIARLRAEGHRVEVCKGADAVMEVLLAYLKAG